MAADTSPAGILWRRLGQAIGLIYGLLGLLMAALAVATLAFTLAPLSRPLDWGLAGLIALIAGGAAAVCLYLGAGFWEQRERALTAALWLHGLPIVGQALRWAMAFQRGEALAPIASPGYLLWSLFIVGFVLGPRL